MNNVTTTSLQMSFYFNMYNFFLEGGYIPSIEIFECCLSLALLGAHETVFQMVE